jgi:membrane protease YdiL (CAAX protease family)
MVAGFIALLVAGVAGAIVVAAIMASKHLKPEQIDSDLRFVLPIQLAIYAGVIGMMYHTIKVRYRQPFGAGVRWNWPARRIWPWFVAGVLLATVVQLAELVVPMPNNLPIEKFFSTPLNAYLMGFLGVVIAPLVEELFFRGFLYPVVARRFGLVGGVLLTGAVFAVFHAGQLGYTWAPLLIMLVVGVTLTAIRAITKSVAASTLTHVTYNFVLMATLWVATDHFHHLERIAQ